MTVRIVGFMTMLLSVALSAPGVAQTKTGEEAGRKANPNDPNFIVCRRQQLSGPVIRYKKVCRTRQEWASLEDLRQDDLEAAANQKLVHSCAGMCR